MLFNGLKTVHSSKTRFRTIQASSSEVYIPHHERLSRYQRDSLRHDGAYNFREPLKWTVTAVLGIGILIFLIYGYCDLYQKDVNNTAARIFDVFSLVFLSVGITVPFLIFVSAMKSIYTQLRLKNARTTGVEAIDLENDLRAKKLKGALGQGLPIDNGRYFANWDNIKGWLRSDTPTGRSMNAALVRHLDKTSDLASTYEMPGLTDESKAVLMDEIVKSASETAPTMLRLYLEHHQAEKDEEDRLKAEKEESERRAADAQAKAEAFERSELTRVAEMRARAALELVKSTS